MRAPRKDAKTTGVNIVKLYKKMYEDKYEENFNPNFTMVGAAEKLAPFYNMTEIYSALKYFFGHGGEDFYDFIKNVNSLLEGQQYLEEGEARISEILRSTRELIKKIEAEEIGESRNSPD